MLRVVTKASTLPVSRADAMAQCRIDDSADTAQLELLDSYIEGATQAVASAASLTLQPTTFEQRVDAWPCGRAISLETGPVREVESVTYLDADGVEQTVAGDDWFLVETSEGGDLYFQPAFSSPALASQASAVRVRFVAGFNDPAASEGDDALDLPRQARQAILLLVADWFANRETAVVGDVTNETRVAIAFERLVGQIRVYR